VIEIIKLIRKKDPARVSDAQNRGEPRKGASSEGGVDSAEARRRQAHEAKVTPPLKIVNQKCLSNKCGIWGVLNGHGDKAHRSRKKRVRRRQDPNEGTVQTR